MKTKIVRRTKPSKPPASADTMIERLVPIRKAFRERLGISVPTAYRWWAKDPTFPKPVRMSKCSNRLAFKESELAAFIAGRERRESVES